MKIYPKDMLEFRADLATKLAKPGYRDAMSETIRAGGAAPLRRNAQVVVEHTQQTIKDAENFFVVPEMCDLVLHAAEALDATDMADVTLAPSKAGFVYFAKPLPLMDIRQAQLFINAMLWDTTSNGDIVVHMWNDEYVSPDEIARNLLDDKQFAEYQEMYGRWGYIGVVMYPDGLQVGDPMIPVSEDVIREYSDLEGFSPDPYSNPIRLVHSLWLLMTQTLVARDREYGDKRTARRMKFMKVPNEVTIITFRRRENDHEYEGEGHVEWSHRWLVRGFWRWQPYKDDDGRWARRRQWINPYIKGPADKPLVVTQKINVFSR